MQCLLGLLLGDLISALDEALGDKLKGLHVGGRRKALRTKVRGDGEASARSFLQIGGVILIVLAIAVAVLRRRTAAGRKNGYAVL